jgi:hypothetical protein
MSTKRIIVLASSFIILFLAITLSGQLVENIPADSIVCIQAPFSGTLNWYTDPGIQMQWFGKVTYYKKSFQYWFSVSPDQGKKNDQSIATRFNDGGHAKISGSVRIDLPLDKDSLTGLHVRYGSQDAIEHELVRTTFERSIYMAGPLMSSAESYSDKRNQLINFIEDQATYGVYKTTTKLTRTKDLISGVEKTVSVVDLIPESKAPGGYARSEPSPLTTFNVKSYNLSINQITYDDVVEKQINAQQAAIMEVQTAIAESRKAEQRALTAAKEGEAKAATAKWEQEVVKAKAVVAAQQEYDVQILNAERELKKAELNKQQMVQYKDAELLRAEGDSTYKKKVMEADGALQPKLATYERVMFRFAEAVEKQKWVPEINMGAGNEGGAGGVGTAQLLIEMLAVKTAKDLALDFSMKGTPVAAKK